LDSTTLTTYTDYSLVNGQTYCYYIRAKGEYSVSGISKPLINLSQIACGIPQDFTAPCPPKLFSLKGNCDDFNNQLIWNQSTYSCADDVVKYNVYRTPTEGGEFILLSTNYVRTDTTFFIDSLFKSIAGCYVVTAIDTFNNESSYSDTLCIDNCPYYELPNVFTPNNDKENDYFEPLPKWKFVESIDLKIFNRWGNLVFTSTEPAILWDGINSVTNQYCPDGVYYYICKVNEIRLKGILSRDISGFAHMYRQDNPPAK
jgi:gliding motility-associated-like protein